VGAAGAGGAAAPPPQPGSPSRAAAAERYSLDELQAYLARFPPAHYAKGGAAPLLAAQVMLLSLRLGSAMRFLAEDPLAVDCAPEAAHLALLLAAAAGGPAACLLDGCGAETRADVAGQAAQLLLRLGRARAGADAAAAADYLSLAAAAAAAAAPPEAPLAELEARETLLRELLRRPGAPQQLLSPPLPRLAQLVPEPARRAALLAAAAAECEAGGQLEQATGLASAAGRPAQALRLLNRQLSEALQTDPAGERAARLLAAGEALRGAAEAAGAEGGAAGELGALRQLAALRALLLAAAAGKHTEVVRLLRVAPELSFVPLTERRVAAAEGLALLHPAVATPDLLARLLLAAARALAQRGMEQAGFGEQGAGAAAARREAMRALAAFGAAARFRVASHVYAEFAQLVSSV